MLVLLIGAISTGSSTSDVVLIHIIRTPSSIFRVFVLKIRQNEQKYPDYSRKFSRVFAPCCVIFVYWKYARMSHVGLKTIIVWYKHSNNDLYDHLDWFGLVCNKNKPKTSKNTHSQLIFTRFCTLLHGFCVLEIPTDGSYKS